MEKNNETKIDKDLPKDSESANENKGRIDETIGILKTEIESLKSDLITLKNSIPPSAEIERLKNLTVENFTKIMTDKTNEVISNITLKASANAASTMAKEKKENNLTIAEILKFKGAH